jgi:hypothetical protein
MKNARNILFNLILDSLYWPQELQFWLKCAFRLNCIYQKCSLFFKLVLLTRSCSFQKSEFQEHDIHSPEIQIKSLYCRNVFFVRMDWQPAERLVPSTGTLWLVLARFKLSSVYDFNLWFSHMLFSNYLPINLCEILYVYIFLAVGVTGQGPQFESRTRAYKKMRRWLVVRLVYIVRGESWVLICIAMHSHAMHALVCDMSKSAVPGFTFRSS